MTSRSSGPRPTVSWIMIFLDAERFIDDAIASVVAQRGIDDWELILVDDGSTDGSTSIARRWVQADCRIHYVDHPGHVNLGMSASRNVGLALARGDVVGFLDSDDIALPTAMARSVEVLRRHPDADAVIGRWVDWYGWTGRRRDRRADAIGPLPPALAVHRTLDPPEMFFEIYGSPGWLPPAICSVVVRRTACERVGGFEPEFRSMFEDQVFIAKVALELRVVTDPEVYALYRHHRQSACAIDGRVERWNPWRSSPPADQFVVWLQSHLHRTRGEESPEWRAVEANRPEKPGCREGLQKIAWNFRIEVMRRLPVPIADLLRSLRAGGRARVTDGLEPGLRVLVEGYSKRSPYRCARSTIQRIERRVKELTIVRPVRRLVRKLRGDDSPPVGGVKFGHLRRITPIAADFGYRRGGPVDRVYIEGFLDEHRADIRGHCLEIGDASYTYRFGANRVTTADVLHIDPGADGATFVGDLADGSFLPDATFDCIVLTQTLHLVYDFGAALRTIARILAPGGVLLMTVPGISNIDLGVWGGTWHYSFTHQSVRRMCADAFPGWGTSVESFGNVLAAVAFLHGLGADELDRRELWEHDLNYSLIHAARVQRPLVGSSDDQPQPDR